MRSKRFSTLLSPVVFSEPQNDAVTHHENIFLFKKIHWNVNRYEVSLLDISGGSCLLDNVISGIRSF